MTSRTIWSDVYEHPHDEEKWHAFRKHYETRIYTWAYKVLGRNQTAADEVTVDVICRLHQKITDPNAAPVTPQGSSCAGFVFTVVRAVCADYRRQLSRQARLTEEMIARLESTHSHHYLARLLPEIERREERALAERDLADLDARFRSAVGEYKQVQATHKERSESWAMFVAAYSVDPNPGLGATLDHRFGFSSNGQRGTALKYAHRVADQLCVRMELVTKGEVVSDERRNQLRNLIRLLVQRRGNTPL